MLPRPPACLLLLVCIAAAPKPKPHNLPAADLKQTIIWGSTAPDDAGSVLAFGGLDQSAPDGIAHTRIQIAGKWVPLYEYLRKYNPAQPFCDRLRKLRDMQKELVARTRSTYLEDVPVEHRRIFQGFFVAAQRNLATDLLEIARDLAAQGRDFPIYYQQQRNEVMPLLHATARRAAKLAENLPADITPQLIHDLFEMQIDIERAADCLDCEPSPRALSPLLYRPQASDFVLFGGDHLDYLTNDVWTFSLKPYRWEMRHPDAAPPPRANHTLAFDDNGLLTVSGGYTYANNTDYLGGQYVDLDDGPWTGTLLHKWKSPATDPVPRNARIYRSGPFHPDFFLDTEKPDAAKFQTFLKSIPVNTWTKTNPPRLPKLNRDWGTAVLDTRRDLILRWSGGHSAHGGTDVLQYHCATNRWELSAPIEFPLGQLYSNTSYPQGVSFNGRAWITGHTYQSYAFDSVSGNMIFTGQRRQFFPYDPDLQDWLKGRDKPKEMSYDSCFYTLTCTTTPAGIYCWTNEGKLFFYDSKNPAPWTDLLLTGEKLAGSIVDNSTLVHDSRRNRLLFFRKEYGDKTRYNGLIQAVDLKTLEVSTLTLENAAAAYAVSYLCQIRYDPKSDLLVAGCTFSANGQRRTPAYDPAANRWISLSLAGDDPSGPKGRNVSLGLMYDSSRKLFWATDTNSQVYVLRLDPAAADPQPLQ